MSNKPEKFMIKSEATEIIHEPFSVYLSNDHFASCSGIKDYKRSPLHKLHAKSIDTEATSLGRQQHEFILEPKEFNKNYFVLDDSEIVQKLSQSYSNPRATKLYKAWFEDEVSKTPHGAEMIKADQFQVMQDMKTELLKHGFVRYLLKASEHEVSAYGMIDGILAKGRFDMLLRKKRWIADFKFVADASEAGMISYIKNYDGHLQPALYTQLAERITNDGMPWKFFWVCQEKVPPYAVGIYKASAQVIAVGMHEVSILLQQHKFCIENNQYDGYECLVDNDFGIKEINLPAYMIKDYQFFNKNK